MEHAKIMCVFFSYAVCKLMFFFNQNNTRNMLKHGRIPLMLSGVTN